MCDLAGHHGACLNDRPKKTFLSYVSGALFALCDHSPIRGWQLCKTAGKDRLQRIVGFEAMFSWNSREEPGEAGVAPTEVGSYLLLTGFL